MAHSSSSRAEYPTSTFSGTGKESSSLVFHGPKRHDQLSWSCSCTFALRRHMHCSLQYQAGEEVHFSALWSCTGMGPSLRSCQAYEHCAISAAQGLPPPLWLNPSCLYATPSIRGRSLAIGVCTRNSLTEVSFKDQMAKYQDYLLFCLIMASTLQCPSHWAHSAPG